MRETFNEWMDICFNQNIDTRMRVPFAVSHKLKEKLLRNY